MSELFEPIAEAGKTKALICFPYGGGWSSIFHPWEHFVDETIAVVPIQFPGRGARMDEPSYSDLSRLIEETAESLSKISLPLYLYGGCFGGMCAYETARRLEEAYDIHVEALFLNSLFAPQLIDTSEKIGDLPEAEFISKIREKGELPDEVLDDEEVLAFLLDGIVADYKLYESYRYCDRGTKLQTNLHLFCKNRKELTDPKYLAWQEYMQSDIHTHLIEAQNLFQETALQNIAESINTIIKGE